MPLKIKIKKNVRKRHQNLRNLHEKNKYGFYLRENDETQEAKEELEKQSNNYIIYEEDDTKQQTGQDERWERKSHFITNNCSQCYLPQEKPETRKRLKTEILQKINKADSLNSNFQNGEHQIAKPKEKCLEKTEIERKSSNLEAVNKRRSEASEEYLRIQNQYRLEHIKKEKDKNFSKIFEHPGPVYRSRTISSTLNNERNNSKTKSPALNFIFPMRKEKERERFRQKVGNIHSQTKQFVRNPSLKKFHQSEQRTGNKFISYLEKRKLNQSRLIGRLSEDRENEKKTKTKIEKSSAIRDQFEKLKRILSFEPKGREQQTSPNSYSPIKIVKL